ncbi:MAG: hypothetical protein HYZ65_01200 [Burkholderiales bacterium]|nr:hypothetical protein [Burkholderiales bacterium]
MKHWKIVVGAAAIALAVNASFAGAIKPGAPQGWTLRGPEGDKYEIGIDTSEGTAERPVLVMASKTQPTEEVLAITQDIDGTEWQGQIIELSMMAKAVGAKKNKVWIRHTRAVGFTWTEAKSIPDGEGWQEIRLRSYYPENPDPHYDNHFDIGVALGSPGKIWIRDVKLAKIAPPSKEDRLKLPGFRSGLPAYPPRNLNFTE